MIFGSPIKLYVQTSKEDYYSGEPLNYNVIVDLKKPRDIKEIKVRLEAKLTGKARCWYRELGNEDEEYVRETFYTIELLSITKSIPVNTRLPKGRHLFNGTIIIPPDAPPTGRSGVFDVAWSLTATIPGFFRRIQDTRNIRVYGWDRPGPEASVNNSSGNLRVHAIIPSYIPRGVSFPIRLDLAAISEPFQCSKITIKLVHELYVRVEDIDTSAEQCEHISYTREYLEQKIAENVMLVPGQYLRFPLTLTIPHSTEPSFKRGLAFSEWKLQIHCSKGVFRGEETSIKLNVI